MPMLWAQVGVESFTDGLADAAFLTWLNERMNFEFRTSSSMLITIVAGVLDLRSKQFKYANAGHNRPFLIRKGLPTELMASGAGLGVGRNITYTEQGIIIKPDDLVFMFTNGLTEIESPSVITEPVKINALLEGVPVGADYHRRVMDASLGTAKAPDFNDDVTIVTARIL